MLEKAKGREREFSVREVMAQKGPEMARDQGKGGQALEIPAMTGLAYLTPGMLTIRSLLILEKPGKKDTRGRSC